MSIGKMTMGSALFLVSAIAGAAVLPLVKVSDTVERAGGGTPLGFSLQLPKGAQPTAKLMPHVRGYGIDVAGGHISLSLTRLNGQLDADYQVRHNASLSGGLETRQELDKNTTLAVMKPQGPQQFVELFKRLSKDEYIQVECSSPPSLIETTKAACGSLTIP